MRGACVRNNRVCLNIHECFANRHLFLKDQQGYLSFEVKKGSSNDLRANAYGHYDHITIQLSASPSIGIKTGSISVGGVTKVTKATSPMILFNY